MINQLEIYHDDELSNIKEKINEIVEVVNGLEKRAAIAALDFEHHTHDVLIGNPENFDSLRHSTGPVITMVNDSDDHASING